MEKLVSRLRGLIEDDNIPGPDIIAMLQDEGHSDIEVQRALNRAILLELGDIAITCAQAAKHIELQDERIEGLEEQNQRLTGALTHIAQWESMEFFEACNENDLNCDEFLPEDKRHQDYE